MGSTVAALGASVGIALVLTAVLLPGRQSPAVLNAAGSATSKIMLASLGQA